MRKVLFGVLGVVAALLAVFVAVVATRPSHAHVERSRTIAATGDDLWPYLSDMRGFTQWEPWSETDPTTKLDYSDPSSGTGASYSWKGDQTGAGKMTITSLQPSTEAKYSVDFTEPFANHADATITVVPADGGSKVTWAFDAENGFAGKAFSLVMDMDQAVGPDFERGLAKLATIGEDAAKKRVAGETKAAAADAAAADAAAPTTTDAADAAAPATTDAASDGSSAPSAPSAPATTGARGGAVTGGR